jgi:8-oxo-dGTP pyrophosphatase MutT (NUDIX family)
MHIKIYFDDKVVYLCDKLDPTFSHLVHKAGVVLINETTNAAVQRSIKNIESGTVTMAILLGANFEVLKKLFFSFFNHIEAAGGIVQNEVGELLFIYRLGKWDLPKGKMEAGETSADCALREVEEETGINGLQLQNKIGKTYHTYHAFGKYNIKTTHWYYFTCPTMQKLQPQLEEDITEVRWVGADNIDVLMQNTYPSIHDILQVFEGAK